MIEALQHVLRSQGWQTDINSLLAVFFLGLTRIGLAISFAPFFGGESLVSPVKLGLSAMLTAMLLPDVATQVTNQPLSPLLFLSLLAKEAVLGLLIGFLAQLVFYGVQTAGALVDTARGMDQPGLLVPQLRSNASAVAQLKFQAALVLFLTLNGHLVFIRALGRSFDQIPLLGFPRMAPGPIGMASQVARISAEVFVVALQLAAPVLIALFIVDACFGLLAKAAPQMNVYMESLPVKSFVGLLVLALAIGYILPRLEVHFTHFLGNLYSVLASAA